MAVSAPPVFQRAPRIYPELPKGEVEIPAPPTVPAAPSMSIVMVIAPAVLAIGALAVLLYTLLVAKNGTFAVYSLLALGGMSLGAVTTGVNFFTQKRNYARSVAEREKRYRALLKQRRDDLTKMREQQWGALRLIDPEPVECLSRVERLDRRLWERSPLDADFLSLRLGLGRKPFSVKIKSPRQDAVLEADPLLEEAQALGREFEYVYDVPICLPLGENGSAGIGGPRPAVLNMVRDITMQIASEHSPDEVKIVAIFGGDEAEEWNSLRWLPHVWTDDDNHRFMATERETAHRLLMSLYDLLNKRRAQASGLYNPNPQTPLPCFVIILAEPRLAENEPILPLLLNYGKSVGAFPIILSDHIDHLPKGCRSIIDLGSEQPELIQTAPAPSRTPFKPDECSEDLAERIARVMAPIELQRLSTATEIPDVVPLLDLLHTRMVEDLDVAARWRKSEAWNSLAVPIGERAGGEPLLLDMHERGHGPHGLAAGATGSGKSELLQSLIASLAVNYHPHQVSFVLIDYKGGGMANAFLGLPHLVGTITNLQGPLATRALAAIRSELQRRQAALAAAGENHVDRYLRRYARGELTEPLPHLIFIADEFAELVTEQPDFMKELISAVRVGRSLGVHLLLATQKPAGVVNEQIWGNARFRICLRVERPEDSQEVLKRPDAASITQPGRAYFQVGNNEVFELFQSAYAGAPYEPTEVTTVGMDEIVELALDGSRRPLRLSPRPLVLHPESNQLQVLVEHIKEVAEREGIKPLQGPWLPPLPESVPLEKLLRPGEGWNGHGWDPASTWLQPIIGMVDDPVHQYQGPLALNLGKEGNIIVYGAPGSGKTTFVRTLIASLVQNHSPRDVNLYMLDFGGRLLTTFAPLPHVGGVVLAEEEERMNRLLRYLLHEMEARKERFAKAGVNNLIGFRNATREQVPALVIVLDNYNGFVGTYPEAEDLLAELAREGGNLGMHVVLTASSPSFVKSKISGNFTLVITLQLADKAEYALAMGRFGGQVPGPFPGRGLVKGNPPLEFQTALAADADTQAARTAILRGMVEEMAKGWNDRRARPVPVLPNVVPLCDLMPPDDAWPFVSDNRLIVPLGLDVDQLEALNIDMNEGPHFMITGPVQSGKTTLLQSWLLALAERYTPQRVYMYLVDMRRSGLSPLQRLPHVKAYIDDDDKLSAALAEIRDLLKERRTAMEQARQEAGGTLDQAAFVARYPALVVAIDDYDAFRDTAQAGTKERLEQLTRRERGLGFHVLVSGSTGDFASSFEGLVKALKELQTGFVMGSNEQSDVQVLNIRLPYGEAGKPLPAGQGYYGRRGRVRKIKAATCQAGMVQVRDWVELIGERKS